MLASFRAELLVLRRWKVAWALLAVAPLLVLFAYYVDIYLGDYVLTDPTTLGSANRLGWILASLMPGEFVQAAVSPFPGYGADAVMVLGAVVAAGDWTRGTITTSLVARPGRVHTCAGQALALATAVATTVVATLVVALGASFLCRAIIPARLLVGMPPAGSAMPPAMLVAKAVGVALFVGVTYAMAGFFIGTVARGVGGAVVVCLVWFLVFDDAQGSLTYQVSRGGGIWKTVFDYLPLDSAQSLHNLLAFDAAGGGAGSGVYQPVTPHFAVRVLLVYCIAFVVGAVIVLSLRDVGVGAGIWSRRRGLTRPRRPIASRQLPDVVAGPGSWLSGVWTSAHAELLVMRRWRALLLLVIGPPLYMVFVNYGLAYASYDLNSPVAGKLYLPTVLPGQLVTVVLNTLDPGSGGRTVLGPVGFFLVGAWVAGHSWSEGAFRTALLQCPGRAQTAIGQAVAVVVAVGASVVCTFALAGAASAIMAITHAGAIPPGGDSLPMARLAGDVGAAMVIALTYAAIGWMLGTVLRNAGAAVAVAVTWIVGVRPILDGLGPELHGVVRAFFDVLPDTSDTTVAHLFGAARWEPAAISPEGAHVAMGLGFAVLGAYALVFLIIPVVVTRRRDAA